MKGKKTGGRTKGSLNKATKKRKEMSREAISELLEGYEESGLMAKDFTELEPRDRMHMAEKFYQYILPKMQATSVDITAVNQEKGLAELVEDLADPDD